MLNINLDELDLSVPESLKLQTDIIDRRKIAQVKKANESYSYAPPYPFNIDQQHSFEKLKRMVGQEGAEMVADGLLAYFYQGTKPKFQQATTKADRLLEEIVKAIENAEYVDQNGTSVPLLKYQRSMAQAQVWTADLLSGLTFTRVVHELEEDDIPPQPPGQGEGEGGGGDQQGQNGEGEGQSGDGKSGDQSGQQGGDGKDDGQSRQGGDAGGGAAHDTQGQGGVRQGKTNDGSGKEQTNANNKLQDKVNKAAKQVAEDFDSKKDRAGQSLNERIENMHGEQSDLPTTPFSPESAWGNARRVADRMGRIKDTLSGAMSDKMFYSSQTPVKVTYGDNIKNAVKSQFVHLGEDTELHLLKQIKDRQLMQRHLTGINRAGKGPIIMCIDVSGSMMHGHDEVSQWVLPEWAFGLAGAIGWAAATRRREVAYIYYSNTVPDILHVPSKYRRDTERLSRAIGSVVHNPSIGSEQPHPLSVIPELQRRGIPNTYGNRTEWKCEVNGGGTDYGAAFNAVEALMMLNPKWKQADVLFLSDGADTTANQPAIEIAERLQSRGVSIYGIGLVKSDRKDERILQKFGPSMGYFNAHVIAEVWTDTDAEDVLTAIGRGL